MLRRNKNEYKNFQYKIKSIYMTTNYRINRDLGQKDGLDVRQDTSLGNCDTGQEFVELFIVTDGKLKMTGNVPVRILNWSSRNGLLGAGVPGDGLLLWVGTLTLVPSNGLFAFLLIRKYILFFTELVKYKPKLPSAEVK